MVGQISSFRMPYYNAITQKIGFKYRPALIIGLADSGGDFNVLPISKISHRHNLDANYDIEIDPAQYPSLCLDPRVISYVRAHKTTVAHISEMGNRKYGNIKTDYPDLYLEIMTKWETYNRKLMDNAL